MASAKRKIHTGDIVVLATTSPDKRAIYGQLFNLYGCYFTTINEVGLATQKTPEKSAHSEANSKEKIDILSSLARTDSGELLKRKVRDGFPKDEQQRTVWGMTEDSYFRVIVAADKQDVFERVLLEKIAKLLPEKQGYMIENVHLHGLPGTHLKPIIEHLRGGFPKMMELIYSTQRELGIENLGFKINTSISYMNLDNPKEGYTETFAETGDLITEAQWLQKLASVQNGNSLGIDDIQIIRGQKNNERKTVQQMVDEGLLLKKPEEMPGEYCRRNAVATLVENNGKWADKVTKVRRPRLSYLHPDVYASTTALVNLPGSSEIFERFDISPLPTKQELSEDPLKKLMNGSDVILLVPSKDNDKNLEVFLDCVVDWLTHPASMGKTILIDNRTGDFNKSLAVVTSKLKNGFMFGAEPYRVITRDDEFNAALRAEHDKHQLKLKIDKPQEYPMSEVIRELPKDGVFTLFIAGGHANNASEYMQYAQDLGYYAASKGWRIVTGGGTIEGPMGGVHTGFIQYHLDVFQSSINKSGVHDSIEAKWVEAISACISSKTGKYLSEEIIEKHYDILEHMADTGYIPRDLFYAYSMQYMIEMESHNKLPPAATTYSDVGNMQNRIPRLTAPSVHVYLPGSLGSDEELIESLTQLKAGANKSVVVLNLDHCFDVTLSTIDKHRSSSRVTKAGSYAEMLVKLDKKAADHDRALSHSAAAVEAERSEGLPRSRS